MKRRFLALVLTLLLALTLIVPALTIGVGDAPSAPYTDTFVTLTSTSTSYVIIEASKWTTNWGSTKTSIAWKDFGAANVTRDNKVDISKMLNVREPSYLVVLKDAVVLTEARSKNMTMASFSSIDSGKLDIYKLLVPAEKPKITKPTFFDDAQGNPVAHYVVDKDFEYQKLGGNSWLTAGITQDGSSYVLDIPVKEYKVEYYFRTKASGEKSASQAVKATVPAMSNAPTTKLDIAKGEIKAKSGWLVKTDQSASGTGTSISSAKTFIIGSDLADNLNEFTIGRATTQFMFRVPSTSKKPGSAWATLFIEFEDGDKLNGNVYDYFSLTAKNVLVVGAIPIQAKINNKWKTVKNIKLTDFEKATDKKIEVRMAGTKTKLPGVSKKLSVEANGSLTLT